MAENEVPKAQPERQLRRAWFGGVRRDDVNKVVDALTEKNSQLRVELAETQIAHAQLTSRATSAEATLEVFDASIRNMGTILALAEEHAKTIRDAAEEDAERIRAEAREQGDAIRAEVDQLLARKQEVVASILALRSSLDSVTGTDPRSQLPPPLPPNVEPH
jgi:chromosome segregation ATPase